MTTQIKTFFLLALLSGLIIVLGGAIGGQSGVIIAFALALFMNVGSYWFSDKIVLRMYKAQEIGPNDSPYLHKIVEELAINAGIPKPKIYFIPDQSPNAFATGRNPEHGVVAVTDGIMKLLTPEELRGVLAHEIAHIAHRDILLQTVAGVLASAITSIASWLQWTAILGGNRNEEGGSSPFAGLLLAFLAPMAAGLIQMAISRTREYHADAGGATYSQDPLALASALNKISNYSKQIPMQNANPATENMFIISPLAGNKMASLFSTHPPTEERIARLQAMANQRNN